MMAHGISPRPLPVVLPALQDELLSSWLDRHAKFYRVSRRGLLRHCSVEAPTLRDLDLNLTRDDQHRLAHWLRCDPWTIRDMTQSHGGNQPKLIATVHPVQICTRCISSHRLRSSTEGARLRSWMEGWRIDCPVCGTALEDARPFDRLTRANPNHPLLLSVARTARHGAAMVTRAARRGRLFDQIVILMRGLLLPRLSEQQGSLEKEKPRLLDLVIPGFDRFLHDSYPGFQRPGTLLLPLSIRIPVLAGIAEVARQPSSWAARLPDAVADTARPALAAAFKALAPA